MPDYERRPQVGVGHCDHKCFHGMVCKCWGFFQLSQKQLGPGLRPRSWLGMKEGRWEAESCSKRLPGVHIPMGECFPNFGFQARITPNPPLPKYL